MTQMCILELKHKKATLLALNKELLFTFTKEYFRDFTAQNMVCFYLPLALWNQVHCTTISEITSFLQSFPQSMNCSSMLGFLITMNFFFFSSQSKEIMVKFYLSKLSLCLCGCSPAMCSSTFPLSIVADSSAVEDECKGQWGIPELKKFSSISQN